MSNNVNDNNASGANVNDNNASGAWTVDCMTCNHMRHKGQQGLCDECELDYNLDPIAWLEFGYHPQGIVNWEREQQLIDAGITTIDLDCNKEVKLGFAVPCHDDDDKDIPF